MWGVVVGVVIAGFVLAAILGAMREKQPSDNERPPLWGTPKQAGTLIVLLLILAAAAMWAVSSNSV